MIGSTPAHDIAKHSNSFRNTNIHVPVGPVSHVTKINPNQTLHDSGAKVYSYCLSLMVPSKACGRPQTRKANPRACYNSNWLDVRIPASYFSNGLTVNSLLEPPDSSVPKEAWNNAVIVTNLHSITGNITATQWMTIAENYRGGAP